MHEIHPGVLWIGNAHDIQRHESLFDAELSAIVDLALEEPPAAPPRELLYFRIPLNDGGGNPLERLQQAIRLTADLVAASTRTIIACSAGMSRSPTIAAHALALGMDKPPQTIAEQISRIRPLEIHPALWTDASQALAQLRR
ncbi:MAG: hypothetical protein QGG36_04415 [Pirellulaceae bacterium]|jgi:protein-tyrosine phosphatase|nr:hypothetical protein [Pirellulaceae bacterium]MDP7015014.1 hypothetical protein [Pirellulaceae bacterium]